ncbi:hypothetical protein [Corynebacterium sp.]|uniref:hypothetical protein n=1 Tax=Corynebacterium sp. TaxID=1720 RepID=UPI00068F8E0F|nr:hypothetical protein [Corynebacterium sp.]
MKSAKKLTAIVAGLAVSSSIFTGVANAAPDPVTGVELNVPLNRTVTLDVISKEGAEFQQALREIRAEMWDKNVPFEGTSLREAAKKAGYQSKDAYVNAAKVDSSLSYISLQRAAENVALGGIQHARPTNNACQIDDCTSIWSAKRNGEQSWGENLSSSGNLRNSIIQLWGRGEESALRASRGEFNDHSGHLWLMINPKYTAYGAANGFSHVNGALREVSVMEASYMRQGDGKTLPDARRQIKVADNGKIRPGAFPSDANPGTVAPQDNTGGMDLSGLLGSLGNGESGKIFGIIAGVVGALAALGIIANFLMQNFGPR